MPRRRVTIEAPLLSQVESIGREEGVSVSQIVNEALAIALVERRRRLQTTLGGCLPGQSLPAHVDRTGRISCRSSISDCPVTYTGITSDRSTSMASVGRAPRSKRRVLSRARLSATCSK